MTLNLIRTVLFAVLFVGVASRGVGAQEVSGGFLAGVSRGSLAHADGPQDPRTGLRAGGFLEVGLSSSLALRAEVAYAMKGVRPDGPPVIALDYIEVPLLATVAFRQEELTPILFAGPAIGVKVRAKYGSLEYGDLVHTWDPSLVFGGGVEVKMGSKTVLLEARYTRGVNPVFDFGDPSDTDSDDKNQTVSVSAAMKLF